MTSPSNPLLVEHLPCVVRSMPGYTYLLRFVPKGFAVRDRGACDFDRVEVIPWTIKENRPRRNEGISFRQPFPSYVHPCSNVVSSWIFSAVKLDDEQQKAVDAYIEQNPYIDRTAP